MPELLQRQAVVMNRESTLPVLRDTDPDAGAERDFLPPEYDDGSDPSARSYGTILWQGRARILKITLLSTAAAILLSLIQKPVYKTHTSLQIQSINQNFLDMQKISPVLISQDASALTPLGDLPTEIEILTSTTLSDRTAMIFDPAWVTNRLSPPHHDWQVQDLTTGLRRAFFPTPQEVQEKALDKAVKSLKVKAIPESHVVNIACTSTDPILASRFLNHLTDGYIQISAESRSHMSQQIQEHLTAQLEEMRHRIEVSDAALQAYLHTSGLVVPSGSSPKFSEDQLRNVQMELNKARADRAAAEARYEIARQASPDTLAEVLDDQQLRAYQSRMTELHQQLAEAQSVFTDSAPHVTRLKAQLQEVEQAFRQMRESTISRIGNDYNQSRVREKLLDTEYQRQVGRVSQDADRSVTYNLLSRDAETNQHLYETMLEQAKQATIASAIGTNNVRIIDSAEVPIQPYAPSHLLYAALGIFLGSMLGSGLVLWKSSRDSSIYGPAVASRYLGISELGVVPTLPGKRKNWFRKDDAFPPDSQLLKLSADSQVASDPFRAILTSILLFRFSSAQPRVLSLSSVNSGEGKTFLTYHLSRRLAETGRRVLVVDTDLRNPQLHHAFGLTNAPGISALLQSAEDASITEIARATQPTGHTHLDLLSAGDASQDGALIHSPRLPHLVDAMREMYDFILFDTPPAFSIPDARVIGHLTDGVILVIRANQTSREDIRSVCQRFQEDGSNVLGTVLNDWVSDDVRYSGYYYTRQHSAGSES